jgi:hypothetical protein
MSFAIFIGLLGWFAQGLANSGFIPALAWTAFTLLGCLLSGFSKSIRQKIGEQISTFETMKILFLNGPNLNLLGSANRKFMATRLWRTLKPKCVSGQRN